VTNTGATSTASIGSAPDDLRSSGDGPLDRRGIDQLLVTALSLLDLDPTT
jgi:hypothetical protein